MIATTAMPNDYKQVQVESYLKAFFNSNDEQKKNIVRTQPLRA